MTDTPRSPQSQEPDPSQPPFQAESPDPAPAPSDEIIAGTGEVAVHAANGLDLPDRVPPDEPPPFVSRRRPQARIRAVGPVDYPDDDPLRPPGSPELGAEGRIETPKYFKIDDDREVRIETAFDGARWLGGLLAERGVPPTARGLVDPTPDPTGRTVTIMHPRHYETVIPEIDTGWTVSMRSRTIAPADLPAHYREIKLQDTNAIVLLPTGEMRRVEGMVFGGVTKSPMGYTPEVFELTPERVRLVDVNAWVDRYLGKDDSYHVTSEALLRDLNALIHVMGLPEEILRERFPHVFDDGPR